MLAFLFAAPAAGQSCPTGRNCYYVPAAQPPPRSDGTNPGSGALFAVGANPYDLIISTSSPDTVTGSFRVDGGANQPFAIDVNTPFRRIFAATQTSATHFATAQARGIFVEASSEVSVVHRLFDGAWQMSTTVKEQNFSLGTRFRVAGYPLNQIYNGNDSQRGLDFISVYAPTNAVVTFQAPPGSTAPFWGDGIATLTHTVSLNAGETYVARNFGGQCNREIDGALVTSTSPIAVTTGGRGGSGICGAGGTCGEEGADQIIPTNGWGNEFVLWSSAIADSYGEDVRIVADTDGTVLTIQTPSSTSTVTLNAGQTHTFVPSPVTRVTSSAPVGVWQNTSNAHCEHGHAFVPPIDLRTPAAIISFNLVSSARATLITRTSTRASVRINNAAVPSPTVRTVPGRPDLTHLEFTLPIGDYQVRADSDFQMGVLAASGGTGLYGYYTPFRIPGCGDGVVGPNEGCDDGNDAGWLQRDLQDRNRRHWMLPRRRLRRRWTV